MLEMLVKRYAEAAGIRCHPHLLRHPMLTFLTAEGKLTDAQIQLISLGHSSKKALEVYQHLNLNQVADDYQAAAARIKI